VIRFEHTGQDGAEAWHAEKVIAATAKVLDASNEPLIREGAQEILEALAEMWDLLDVTLLIPDLADAAA
jgi:hypothetical protein